MRKRHLWLGVSFWALAAVFAWCWTSSTSPGQQHQVSKELRHYLTSRRRAVNVRLPRPTRLAIGDPIFADVGTGLQQIGEVQHLLQYGLPMRQRDAVTSEASLVFYTATPPIDHASQLTLFETPDTLAWVVETLLPKQRKEEVAAVLQRSLDTHREEMVAALRPIVEGTVKEALAAVRVEFPKVFERHRYELEQLGRQYQEAILEDQLLPIVKRDILPAVQAEAEPIVAEIGWELWQRLSLWRFSWRMTYDWLPLTRNRLVRNEWNRFLQQDVRFVVSGYQDDFLEIVRHAAMAILRNEDIRMVIGGSLEEIASNPEFQAMMLKLFDELVVHNPRLHEVVNQRWQSPETQHAVRLVSARMEPAAEQIGLIVLGSIEEGLTPEFAQVLRTRILSKDQRWILAENPNQVTRSVETPLELKVRLASDTRAHNPRTVVAQRVLNK